MSVQQFERAMIERYFDGTLIPQTNSSPDSGLRPAISGKTCKLHRAAELVHVDRGPTHCDHSICRGLEGGWFAGSGSQQRLKTAPGYVVEGELRIHGIISHELCVTLAVN